MIVTETGAYDSKLDIIVELLEKVVAYVEKMESYSNEEDYTEEEEL